MVLWQEYRELPCSTFFGDRQRVAFNHLIFFLLISSFFWFLLLDWCCEMNHSFLIVEAKVNSTFAFFQVLKNIVEQGDCGTWFFNYNPDGSISNCYYGEFNGTELPPPAYLNPDDWSNCKLIGTEKCGSNQICEHFTFNWVADYNAQIDYFISNVTGLPVQFILYSPNPAVNLTTQVSK